MKKKAKSNVIRIIVICVVIICTCIVLYMNNPKHIAENRISKINEEEVDGSSIFPKNLYLAFQEYKGDIDVSVAGKDFEYYSQTIIPKYFRKYKNMTKDEMIEYYNKNSEVILKEIGLNNVNDFINIVDEITNLDGEKLNFTSYEIIKGTISFINNKSIGCLKIIYNETEELYLNFEIKADNFSYEHPVKITAGVEVESVKKQEVINEQEGDTEIQYNQTGKVIN